MLIDSESLADARWQEPTVFGYDVYELNNYWHEWFTQDNRIPGLFCQDKKFL